MDGLERPTSPFLIYRWQITNTLSILHRATGGMLSLGLLVLVCWLVAAASGSEAYANVQSFYASGWFKLPLAGWAFCFFYHLANGIRHLFWDAGFGFGKRQINLGGWAVVVFSMIATLVYVATVLL
jgi:succinate dehydrogenase / fumarate reductase cytochrome b subunit